jgi:hypothetical protein
MAAAAADGGRSDNGNGAGAFLQKVGSRLLIAIQTRGYSKNYRDLYIIAIQTRGYSENCRDLYINNRITVINRDPN